MMAKQNKQACIPAPSPTQWVGPAASPVSVSRQQAGPPVLAGAGAPVMHSMHRKVPEKSSGRTSVVRVTVPTNWLSLPMREERSARRRSLSGRP